MHVDAHGWQSGPTGVFHSPRIRGAALSSGNPITDAGLAELSAMWSLEVLDIHDTSVTAAGLRKLRLLPELRTLIVPGGVDIETLAYDFDRQDLQIIALAVGP